MPARLEELRLKAEILGRTERLNKIRRADHVAKEIAVGAGPTLGAGATVKPEALERARQREEKEAARRHMKRG